MHYLYKITNVLNKKVYIGQTINTDRRWQAHGSYAKNPERTGQYIHRAMAKYGIENFTYEVIAACHTQEDADVTEEILIQQYNSRSIESGYNIKPGGNCSGHSEETKHKISKTHQGMKHTDETIAKMKGRPGYMKGKKHSDETIQKMSEKAKANRAVINKPGRRKLSPDQTQAIIKDTRSQRLIAKEYGVDRELISIIKKRGN